MGRSSKHLWYFIVSVKPPSEGRSEKALASFWAQELNQLSLDSVTASTTEQCYFKKLCGRHYSKQSPKSLYHNFQKRGGTSLDCKACQVYNWKNKSVKPSQYESAAYQAVFNLPADLQVAEQEVLIDHKLLGGALHDFVLMLILKFAQYQHSSMLKLFKRQLQAGPRGKNQM